jgi:transcriptional regulator with XRE-family HTH domain
MAAQIPRWIGSHLRRLRRERGWSLERAAAATGVSKQMLGQIERGESCPTVTTLWKIARGFQVPFSALLAPVEPEVRVSKIPWERAVVDGEGTYRVVPVVPVFYGTAFEWYAVRIDVGGRRDADAHPPGVEECVVVVEGTLHLEIEGKTFPVRAGEFGRFSADVPHAYVNAGDVSVYAYTAILYRGKSWDIDIDTQENSRL